jgi:hypothetical protein
MDHQNKSNNQDDNVPSIPITVLDRFIKLTQEQQEAYSAMSNAVDSMSAKMLELADQVSTITDTIVKEELAQKCEDIKVEVSNLKTAVSGIDSQYNVVSILATSLKNEECDAKEVKELATALGGLLSVIAFFQKRKYVFIFVTGAALVALFGTASEGVKSVIKFIIGLL